MRKPMTVADMRKALDRFKDDEIIIVNVMQENKVYGVYQERLQLNDNFSEEQPYHRYSCIDGRYGGCCINVTLPEGMYTVQKNKK